MAVAVAVAVSWPMSVAYSMKRLNALKSNSLAPIFYTTLAFSPWPSVDVDGVGEPHNPDNLSKVMKNLLTMLYCFTMNDCNTIHIYL